MKRLTKLANKYETDKGTTTHDAHGYTEFYQAFFEKYESPKILEIGTYKGNSAKMFNAFYDGDCEIWTCDIVEEMGEYVKDMPNVHFVHLNVTNKDEINTFVETIKDVEFDIIIDDASHIWQDQMNALVGFHKLLSPDGIYILEDIHYSRLFIDPENSPLFFLNFLVPNNMLTEEENEMLINSIKDVQIWSRKNLNYDMPLRFGGRSMTAIITFEK